MSYNCPNCGVELNGQTSYCTNCGFYLAGYQQQLMQEQQQITYVQAPQPIQQQNRKQPKQAKKRKIPGVVCFFLWVAGIAAFLLFLWFGFGNIITLNIHSQEVVETINSGSLDLPGMQSDYSKLPQYVKEMLGENEQELDQPIKQAILPYLKVECTKVNGLFGASSIEYIITAPDIGSWLLTPEVEEFTTEDEFLAAMLEYIPNAPSRQTTVTIEYYKDGFFSVDWRGNYYTVEFADAISGGMNTAYNELYKKAMAELEDLLG